MREKRKEIKASLLGERSLPAVLPRSLTTRIVAHTFVEDSSTFQVEAWKRALKLFLSHPLLNPLLTVMDAGCQQRFVAGKRFKIFVMSSASLPSLIDSYTRDGINVGAAGSYHFKNSIYVLAGCDRQITISYLIHEAAHYAMQMVFSNASYPYAVDDAEARAEFKQIVKITATRFKELKHQTDFKPEISMAIQSINTMMEVYQLQHIDRELIAHFFEVIAYLLQKTNRLAVDRFVDQYLPELKSYFMKTILPKIQLSLVNVHRFNARDAYLQTMKLLALGCKFDDVESCKMLLSLKLTTTNFYIYLCTIINNCRQPTTALILLETVYDLLKANGWSAVDFIKSIKAISFMLVTTNAVSASATLQHLSLLSLISDKVEAVERNIDNYLLSPHNEMRNDQVGQIKIALENFAQQSLLAVLKIDIAALTAAFHNFNEAITAIKNGIAGQYAVHALTRFWESVKPPRIKGLLDSCQISSPMEFSSSGP